jgi:hypothetical protein
VVQKETWSSFTSSMMIWSCSDSERVILLHCTFLEMIHERDVLTPHYVPLKKIMSCVWHTRLYDIILRWHNYIEQTIEFKTCTLQTRRSKTSSKGVDHKCELIFRKSKIELLPVRSSRLQLQLQACPCPLQSECNNCQTVVDKERRDKA